MGRCLVRTRTWLGQVRPLPAPKEDAVTYCNVCGGSFYVEETWDGHEWQPVLYNERERSPHDVICTECAMYLPLEENVIGDKPSRLPTVSP